MSEEAEKPPKPKDTGEKIALIALSFVLVLLTLAVAIKGVGSTR